MNLKLNFKVNMVKNPTLLYCVHILGILLHYLVLATLIFYPIAVYIGIQQFGLTTLMPILCAVFIIRFLSLRNKTKLLLNFGKLSAAIGITLTLASWIFKQNDWLMYYPVFINLLLLIFFVTSLKQPQTIIERIARLSDPNLSASAILYTRRVTQVWSAFFILNGSIALFTCLMEDMALWTLYNGGISYCLMGFVMGIEWCIRRKFKQKQAINS